MGIKDKVFLFVKTFVESKNRISESSLYFWSVLDAKTPEVHAMQAAGGPSSLLIIVAKKSDIRSSVPVLKHAS